MAATGRSRGELAATLADAPFVRVAPRADGDAVAAAGLVLRALAARSTPFRARVVAPTDGPPDTEGDEGVTLPLGFEGGPASDEPASLAGADLVADLGDDPDRALALAGYHAAGVSPNTVDLAADLDRREGVGIPTTDLADGLAHSTLVHADFSGDERAASAALDELADDDSRSVASLVALETATADGATPRAAEQIERALYPHATPDGPFETVEGYADVLDCLARETPGLALALAMGHDVRNEALEAWRVHAKAAHRALREATTGRYDGLFVARTDEAPVETTARLLRDFRSPEPVVLVVADGEAAVASVEDADADLGRVMTEAATAVDGAGGGTARRGVATYDGEARAFIAAVREAIP